MSLARAALAEALGTGMLVLFGPGAIMVDAWSGGRLGPPGIALAFGGAVAAAVAVFGPVSGAHINPAVTIALWRSGRFAGRGVPIYIAAQCLGAVTAALLLRATLGNAGRSGATIPAITPVAALAVEVVLSLVLMLAVLAMTEARPSAPAPLVLGLTVGLCALVGGPLTGASMNPARSFGPALAGGAWTHHWLYWLAPIIGMQVAVPLHAWMRGEMPRPAATA